VNLIIGNCAGTFSTVLKYLSWMIIEDIPENQISLQYHWANKTDFAGNTYYNYKNSKKENVYDLFLHRPNIIEHLFDFKLESFRENYEEYVEDYPHNSLYLIQKCPEFLVRYKGGGSDILQYSDSNVLSIIRNTYNYYWRNLKLSTYLSDKLYQELDILNDKKVLTVMIRCSAHYLGSEFFLNNLIEEVKNKIEDYDKILILTQVQEVFDAFIDTFGDLCIFPERERISGNIDWKGGRGVCMSDEEYVKEVEDCLIDVFLASKTSHIMSGASNMFLGALTINPEITFNLFESLKSFNGA
jgi:hypothetical protein